MSDSKILVDVDALECILEYMSDIERSLSLSEALAVIAIRAEEKARDYEYSGSQGLVTRYQDVAKLAHKIRKALASKDE